MFESKEEKILITTLLNEGVDLPSMDVVFNISGLAKDRATIQIGGRVLTMAEGKTEAIILDFYDKDGGLLEKWSKNREKEYRKLDFEVNRVEPGKANKIWGNNGVN